MTGKYDTWQRKHLIYNNVLIVAVTAAFKLLERLEPTTFSGAVAGPMCCIGPAHASLTLQIPECSAGVLPCQ